MNATIPSVAEVRSSLEPLGHAELQRLSRLAGVPFNTLWNIRNGTTANPGIETVRKFLPQLAAMADAG
jgi:hypothetical protein